MIHLSADLYKQIVASLRSDSHSHRNLEKRGAPRVGLRSKLTIIPAPADGSPGQPVSTWVRDLSTNGIGLVHHEPMPVGCDFIAMFAGRMNDSLSVIYTVANCKEISKNLYCIGATLSRVE